MDLEEIPTETRPLLSRANSEIRDAGDHMDDVFALVDTGTDYANIVDSIEEARIAKVGRSPYSPTLQEREVHEATHLPYRSWCAVCVAGRRDNAPHRTVKPQEHQVLEVGTDYCFMRRRVEEDTTTVVVTKDRDSRAIRAHALKFEGTCLDEASTFGSQAIQACGHKGELAIEPLWCLT